MLSKKLFVALVAGIVVLGGAWGTNALAAGQEKAAGGSTAGNPDVFGTITKVSDGSITLQPYKSSSTVVVPFNDATVVIIEKNPGKATDLKVGMHAGAWVKGSNPATKIAAYTPRSNPTTKPAGSEPKANVYGTITKVGSGSITIQPYPSGQAVVVAFNSATVVIIDKNTAKASDLKAGMHAAAWVKGSNPATKISAYMPKSNTPTSSPASTDSKPDVFGTITKVSDGSITLQPYKSDSTVVVAFNDATVVIIEKNAAKATDLKVGMHAGAWVKGSNPATKISAYTPKSNPGASSPASTDSKPDVFGTITKVSDGSITLQPYKSDSTVVVAFNDATVVIIEKNAAKATDLKVGMHAGAWVKGGNPATKISAYTPKPPHK